MTYDEAIKYLPDGPQIHTFRNSAAGLLLGADWEREDLLATMRKYAVLPTGPGARAMRHGLALRDDQGVLFIETKELPNDPTKPPIE